jgi:hypothetical protein
MKNAVEIRAISEAFRLKKFSMCMFLCKINI